MLSRGGLIAMLELENVSVRYGAVRALIDVNLRAENGTIVALIGANGAGKSSLLNAISGVVDYEGKISWNGEVLSKNPPEVVRKGVVQVPEGRQVFDNLSVYENLLSGAYLRWDKRGIENNIERVYSLFPRLKERAQQSAGTLSGGERQMLAIGRGLMSEPSLLLIDEPSLGLSPILATNVLSLIQEINRQGVTVLLVEQNARKSLEIAHRGYVLQNGRIVMEGTGEELLNDSMVQEAYLGASRK
jgi:branched-chain amino acid transport system ATP-binding protein